RRLRRTAPAARFGPARVSGCAGAEAAEQAGPGRYTGRGESPYAGSGAGTRAGGPPVKRSSPQRGVARLNRTPVRLRWAGVRRRDAGQDDLSVPASSVTANEPNYSSGMTHDAGS